jgi:glycine/D-amino acid oxidase-like deaminating enzyme
MDLRSGQAFWLVKNGLLKTYPALAENLDEEVVILGGGITGALIAYAFSKRGIPAVLVEKREIGWGSTAASTAMLQYEIDTNLYELINLIGKAKAEKAYWQGIDAINQIDEICQTVGQGSSFKKHPSLYIAKTEQEYQQLGQEFEARIAANLPVEWISGINLNQDYGLRAEAAIKSEEAAVVDAYQLTHNLLREAENLGARIYDRTELTDIKPQKTGYRLTTNQGYTVNTGKLIFATGYESVNYLKQDVVTLKSTYALATEPMNFRDIGGEYLLWEMSRPYFYMRPTTDQRLLMGGGDIPFKNNKIRDSKLKGRIKDIQRNFSELYPDLQYPDTAFCWAGTFGETKDGLPYIGESAEWESAYFALGYGGNGITYSLLASNILADCYQNIPNPNTELYSFNR